MPQPDVNYGGAHEMGSSDVGSIASGVGQLGGAAVNAWSQNSANEVNMQAVRETNAANAALANKQMQFQLSMSNTAHVREMADLRNAGLNPILSGTGGGGASTPAGASATMQAPEVKPVAWGDILSKGVSSAMSGALMGQQIENAKAQNTKTLADAAVSVEQAALTRSQAAESSGRAKWQDDLLGADFRSKTADTRAKSLSNNMLEDTYVDRLEKIRQEAKQSLLETRKQGASVPVQEERAKYDKAAAGYDALIDRVQSTLGAVTSGMQLSNAIRPTPARPMTPRDAFKVYNSGSK